MALMNELVRIGDDGTIGSTGNTSWKRDDPFHDRFTGGGFWRRNHTYTRESTSLLGQEGRLEVRTCSKMKGLWSLRNSRMRTQGVWLGTIEPYGNREREFPSEYKGLGWIAEQVMVHGARMFAAEECRKIVNDAARLATVFEAYVPEEAGAKTVYRTATRTVRREIESIAVTGTSGLCHGRGSTLQVLAVLAAEEVLAETGTAGPERGQFEAERREEEWILRKLIRQAQQEIAMASQEQRARLTAHRR